MNEPFSPSDENLSPTLARQMERICDRFEAAWKAGQQPRIEDYLGEMPEPERPDLFRELLGLELAYRGPGGRAADAGGIPGPGPPGAGGRADRGRSRSGWGLPPSLMPCTLNQ